MPVTGYPEPCVERELLAPPPAHPRGREVREHGRTGPDHTLEGGAVRIVAEHVLREPLAVHRVVIVLGDARIDDDHRVHPFGGHLVDQVLDPGPRLGTEREVAELLHVVDVEVHPRQRQVVLREPVPHGAHRVGRPVAPARLVVPERPTGRRGGSTGERRVRVEDLGQGADRDMQPQGSSLELRHQLVAGRVDRGVTRVVDEAVRGAVVIEGRVHRRGDVQRIPSRQPGAAGFGVPAAVPAPPQVPPGPSAEPMECGPVGKRGPQGPADAVPRGCLVAAAGAPVRIEVGHRPVTVDPDDDPRAAGDPAAVGRGQLGDRGLDRAGHHRVRRLREGPLPADGDLAVAGEPDLDERGREPDHDRTVLDRRTTRLPRHPARGGRPWLQAPVAPVTLRCVADRPQGVRQAPRRPDLPPEISEHTRLL